METTIQLRTAGLELARKTGFYSSFIAFIAAAGYGIAQIFQIVGVFEIST